MKKLIILGASGGSLDILNIISCDYFKKKIKFLGFLDDNIKKVDNSYKKYVLGSLKDIHKFSEDIFFALAFGNEKNFFNRPLIIKKLNLNKKRFINLIHPESIVHETAKIGFGVVIHAQTIISRNVKIGDFTTILPQSVINHDSIIGSYSILNSKTNISGDVVIGKNSYIGASSVIRDHIKIEHNVLVGIGSVVTKNLAKKKIYLGNPARFYKEIIC